MLPSVVLVTYKECPHTGSVLWGHGSDTLILSPVHPHAQRPDLNHIHPPTADQLDILTLAKSKAPRAMVGDRLLFGSQRFGFKTPNYCDPSAEML